MQKPYILFFLIVLFIPCHSFSQDTITQATVSHKKISSTNHINPGFYIKLGPTFPIRTYSKGIKLKTSSDKDTSYYLPASMGGAMDLGFLIYIGPSFANHHIRLGIDATFLSIWFNSIKSDTITGPISNT